MKIKEKFNKDKLWFTSDLHLLHNNIIKYCSRPFPFMESHDNKLIENWNTLVKEDDNIFILGDFMFTSKISKIKEVLNLLNGKKWLLLGNHCYQNRFDRQSVIDLFEGRVMDAASIKVIDDELEDGLMKIFMSHYPHAHWDRGAIHLHGHLHTGSLIPSSESVDFNPMRYDVGIDNNKFKPISYEEVKIIITKQMLK